MAPAIAAWAAEAYRAMKELEMRYNATEKTEEPAHMSDATASTAAARP